MSEAKPKRARTVKGQYQGDNPATPDVNEAYVQPEKIRPIPPMGSAAYKAMILRGEISVGDAS